jgi:hypothetical protein
MEFIGKWLDKPQRIYLVEIRGYWNLAEADPQFLDIIDGDDIPAYLVLDPTGAIIPEELVQPTTWSLETEFTIKMRRFLSRSDVCFMIHIMNNDNQFFERTQEYYAFLDLSHKVKFFSTMHKSLEFIRGISQ